MHPHTRHYLHNFSFQTSRFLSKKLGHHVCNALSYDTQSYYSSHIWTNSKYFSFTRQLDVTPLSYNSYFAQSTVMPPNYWAQSLALLNVFNCVDVQHHSDPLLNRHLLMPLLQYFSLFLAHTLPTISTHLVPLGCLSNSGWGAQSHCSFNACLFVY
ncbi:hypothetical protein MHYP_G00320490 [Metynnis hypsauchen]